MQAGLAFPQPSLATVLPKGHPTLLPSPWPQDVPAVAPEGWRPWEHHLVHSAPQNILTHWLFQEEAGSIFAGELDWACTYMGSNASCSLPWTHFYIHSAQTHPHLPSTGLAATQSPPRTTQAPQTSIKFLK